MIKLNYNGITVEGNYMKKILSLIIAITILVLCFSVPCMAEGAGSARVEAIYNAQTKMLTLSGNVFAGRAYGTTFYLLRPGKIQQDIEKHSIDNPVVENYGQFDAKNDGTFTHTLKISGEPGIYTLYFQANKTNYVKQLDLTKDSTSAVGPLDELYNLPTTFPKATKTTVKDLFFEKRAELPDEMPVIRPASVEGRRNVYIDVVNGNDATGDGSFANPFKTVNKAIKINPPKTGIAYVLREGTYPISDRIVLSNVAAEYKDPFIITNYKDEKVVFAGGSKIDGKAFEKISDTDIIQRLDPTVIDDILVVDLPSQGITNYGTITTSNSPILFVGESTYQLARWPNSETTTMKKYTGPEQDGTTGVIDSGYNSIAVGSNVGPARPYSKRATANNEAAGEIIDKDQGIQFCITDLRPFSWVNTGDIWVYGRFYDEWTLNHFNISEFHPENGSIRTKTGLNWGCQYKAGNTFYYYNVLEELDAPGEWFLDRNTGKLYLYPTQDLSDANIVLATSASTIFQFTNVQNMIINGIEFEHARGAAINFTDQKNKNIIIQNCSFENVGSGVTLRGTYSGVIDCYFKNLTGKGISLAENDEYTKTLTPQYMFAQNNVMYYTTGISLSGTGMIASHNFISNNKGSCISTSTTESVIEYNEIVGGPTVVEDSGAMYIGGNNLFRRANHIRYNYIHDAPPKPRGIYFDDMAVEYYAYGNIVSDGGWVQLHNGSEHTIYNNILMNNTTKANIISGNANYFTQSRNGSVRWRVGSLEYGSMTAKLKPGSGFNALEGPYAERYPLLKRWAILMQQRIDEYNELVASGMDKVKAAKTCNIPTDYYDSYGSKLNLNEYLAASKDNYFENNIMINTGGVAMGQPGDKSSKGQVNTVYVNNVSLTAAQNPIAGKSFADEATYDAIRQHIPGFETIPFEKIGLLDEEDYTINAKARAVSPVNTKDVAISSKDLSIQWTAVDGAQKYILDVATDENFSDIIEHAELFSLSHKLIAELESDKTYYWRVTTIPKAICSKGSQLISDTFCFKTLPEMEVAERNQVGVTSYSVDNIKNDSFKVTTYVYNLKAEDANAIVYVACYDAGNKLIEVGVENVSVPAKTIEGEYVFEITAPKTNMIKFFVWSADGTMIPYTFVKTLK